MHKERKETTHVRIGERKTYINIYVKNISTMYINNGHKTHVEDINVSKMEKRKKIQIILTTSHNVHSSPNKNLLY